MKLEFSRRIFEKLSLSDLMKIISLEAELFRADGQTDRHDEANSRVSQRTVLAPNCLLYTFHNVHCWSRSVSSTLTVPVVAAALGLGWCILWERGGAHNLTMETLAATGATSHPTRPGSSSTPLWAFRQSSVASSCSAVHRAWGTVRRGDKIVYRGA